MNDFQYGIVAKAIDHLINDGGDAGSLEDLGLKFGYDPTHFQKMFKDKVGISPKRMMQYLSYRRARDFLLQGYPTLEAAYQAGLSGGGRLHDLFVSIEGVTPGDVQRHADGLKISYGFHETLIGEVLIGQTEHGLCWTAFVMNGDQNKALEDMQSHWLKAHFIRDPDHTKRSAQKILQIWRGREGGTDKIKLHLQGTNFQIQVWRALLKIPSGAVVSYGQIAKSLGDEKASRAVGTAVGSNPVALLIPCHRVIQKSGVVENYAWGTSRKKMILALEAQDIQHGIKTGGLFDQPLGGG